MGLNLPTRMDEIILGNDEIEIIQDIMERYGNISLILGKRPRASGSYEIPESYEEDIHFCSHKIQNKIRWSSGYFEIWLNKLTNTLYITSKYSVNFYVDTDGKNLRRDEKLNYKTDKFESVGGGIDTELDMSGILLEKYGSDEQYKIFKKFNLERNNPKQLIIKNTTIDSRDYNLLKDMLHCEEANYIDFSFSKIYVDDWFNNLEWITKIKEVDLSSTHIYITNRNKGLRLDKQADIALEEIKKHSNIDSSGLMVYNYKD